MRYVLALLSVVSFMGHHAGQRTRMRIRNKSGIVERYLHRGICPTPC